MGIVARCGRMLAAGGRGFWFIHDPPSNGDQSGVIYVESIRNRFGNDQLVCPSRNLCQPVVVRTPRVRAPRLRSWPSPRRRSVSSWQAAKRQVTNPKNTIYSIKRFMGRKYDEVAHGSILFYEVKGANGDAT